MEFRTKLPFTDRQVKQLERTGINLSGSSVFGLPFSGLSSGVDTTTSGITEIVNYIPSTFSGNTGTTVFTFGDSRMNLVTSGYDPITSSNSGVTQTLGPAFTASSSTVIDGNPVDLAFTGVQFDFSVTAMTESPAGVFTGAGQTEALFILSADSLDFTGRTIWVDVPEILRTKKLIVSDNPVAGYVLKADAEGMATWQPDSTGTTPTTFWEEGAIGNTALRDNKGSYTLSGTSTNSMIAGGTSHTLSGAPYSIIAGGHTNAIYGGDYEGIFAGQLNIITDDAQWATIIGGRSNSIQEDSDYSTIIASFSSDIFATNMAGIFAVNNGIISGSSATAQNSVLIGGKDQTITHTGSSDDNMAILGGNGHSVEWSLNGVIIGGNGNRLTDSDNSVIIGGASITGTQSNTVYTPNVHVTEQLGVGKEPAYVFDVLDGTGAFYFDGGAATGPTAFISGGDDELNRLTITDGTTGLSLGVRGANETSGTKFGNKEDAYLLAGASANGLYIINSDNPSGADDYIRLYAGLVVDVSATTAHIHIQGSGSTQGFVGFNTEAPTKEVDINGELRIRTVGAGPGTTDLGVDGSGNVVDQASDIRLKENIKDITSPLNKVTSLRGVTYNWKDRAAGGDATRYGFIAQEVKKVVPELTYQRDQHDYMGVHYKEVTALLVEAVKELADENSPLFKRNEIILETQTIAAEDNNIDLNYGGNHNTAIAGGITVLHGVSDEEHSFLKTNADGWWVAAPGFIPQQFIAPEYTPVATEDTVGKKGELTWDNDYIYIKTENGWRRSSLENF